MITSTGSFNIPQITLSPFCIGLNLSILTRSKCYGLVPRQNFPRLRVGPTPMSVELIIVQQRLHCQSGTSQNRFFYWLLLTSIRLQSVHYYDVIRKIST